jgi:hypothetical protein
MRFLLLFSAANLISASAYSFFIDGSGHYSLKPATQTNPGYSEERGLYQATKQSFSLLANVKAGDNLNLKMNVRLFDDPRSAYLGDQSSPEHCNELVEDDTDPNSGRKTPSNQGSESYCSGRHQNTAEPAYDPYLPRVTEVYVEYGFDYCLLEAGRRSRSWGLGMFLDSGRDPFENSASIFDGVTCNVNAIKNENLSFAIGFDRLTETGSSIDVGLPTSDSNYGPNKNSDDIDQVFLSIDLNDRKNQEQAWFARHIGIYIANVFGRSKVGEDKSKVETDIKFADLYTGLYFGGFSIQNEVLFRLGKTGDPNWTREGGIANDSTRSTVKNNVDAIASAGRLEWVFGKSGSYSGPKEYNLGTASSHTIFGTYAYAPGDRDGYLSNTERLDNGAKKVKAVSFHRNFKPAYILFNGSPELDDLRVDGIFDPDRIVNATVFTLGYRYDSLKYGAFETKFIAARLNTSMPEFKRQEVQAEEASRSEADEAFDRRPIGYSGTDLGYEVDLTYQRSIGKQIDLGLAGALGLPGSAWRTSPTEKPVMSYLLMGQAAFKF